MVEATRVNGNRKVGNVMVYALSTCVWCKKVRRYLEANDIEYSYLYVDLLDKKDIGEIDELMSSINPRQSFPTIVINGSNIIIGYDEDKLEEAFGNGK